MSPPGSSLPPRKRIGSPLVSPRPSQSLRRYIPPCLLFRFFYLSCPFSFLLVALRSSRSGASFLSSYEKASGSSFRAGQLEGELKALKKEKAREEGVLQRRLKNLEGEHITLQEKYVASVCRTEVVRAELEGVQVEMDSAVKERDHLRAGKMRCCKPTTTYWTS
ncbi:hypothetical protein LIER_40378 [Lithospermum erythrorhizon]|uniref:Uncharacterized protein n=1 Tax=Lithospermum erythrorhizon TaxID=34254 RepID=A0AAV3QTQ2_LITER